MLRKISLKRCVVLITLLMFTSCYSTRMQIGNGAEGSKVYSEKNHFYFFGLIEGKQANVSVMTQQAENCTVTVEHELSDIVFGILTLGVYTPNTVHVQK